VVTTIHSLSPAVLSTVALQGWAVVIVGDQGGKPINISEPNVVYLDAAAQQRLGSLQVYAQISTLLPWRHFGRKNIGYLYAVEHGAKQVCCCAAVAQHMQSLAPSDECSVQRSAKTHSFKHAGCHRSSSSSNRAVRRATAWLKLLPAQVERLLVITQSTWCCWLHVLCSTLQPAAHYSGHGSVACCLCTLA
jgi:uncharacterized ParB-like nuclease family protein